MPIMGLVHPTNGKRYRLDGPLDDFRTVMPPPVVRDIVRRQREDTRHSGDHITVTGGLGCPRRLVIERFMQHYSDPTKMWAVTAGSVLHEWLGSLHEDGWVTEEENEAACSFSGTLFGMAMGCKVDARKLDHSAIIDYKTSLNGATKWIKRDDYGQPQWDDKDAHVIAQLNMCRLLMAQQVGCDASGVEMWVWGMSESTVLRRCPVWDEERIGRVHPGGSKYTVREHFIAIKAAFDLLKDVDYIDSTARNVAASMPLFGLDMWKSPKTGGNSCVSMCAVKMECDSCQGGI